MATLRNIGGFQETNKRIKVTLSGWEGKSYNGESFSRAIWTHPLNPDKQFVMVPHYSKAYGRIPCFHEVTGERHEKSGELKAEFYTDI